MVTPKFTFLITTKNRLKDLELTLFYIKDIIKKEEVECVITDDGSDDGTFDFVKNNYPQVKLHRNDISKGYIYCRNKMLNETTALYAISLDDDAHIVSENSLELIANHFENNINCGLISFRIFWGKILPESLRHNQVNSRVKGFVGCGHVWRMAAWKSIPNYPEWFIFYGEEEFASYQLFKANWEVHYNPDILVQHRVDVKNRKNQNDYGIRLQRSLRSGWCLFVLFYPLSILPKIFFYSLWIQFKAKVFKGDLIAFFAIVKALAEMIYLIPKLFENSNRLTKQEFKLFKSLPDTKLYWNP